MSKKITTEDFIKKAVSVHGDKYDYSKVEYVNSFVKVNIICPEHGEFKQAPHNHLKKYGCSKCGAISSIKSRISSTLDFIEKARSVHGNKYDYSKVEYNHNKQKVIINCVKHGYFLQTPNCHLKGQGCPVCSRNELTDNMYLTTDEFIEKARSIHSDKYDYSKVEYVGNKSPVVITCSEHGDFTQKPYHHLRKQGCPKCGISSSHAIILDMLKDFDVEINNRDILDGKELDILIPSRNIAIEINGCYWHGLKKGKRSCDDRDYKNIHRDKLKLSQDNNLTLLQFWDYEINNKTDIVRSMILHRLNSSNRLYARSLQVISCDNDYVRDFMNKSHLQGHRNASVNYALIKDDDILAVLNFSRHSKHEWEIIRYACKLNNAIIGGFSRLLSRFINDHNPSQIMTFADSRYSIGNVYFSNGFRIVGITDPNYFYIKNGEFFSRQKCQKHKLHKFLPNFKCELSETENMLENGYIKVYDAGHIKLIWDKK